jgi:vitamin B12 transporter
MVKSLSVRGASAAAFTLLSVALAGAAAAQAPLDAVVVTAARSAQRAADVLPATTVLMRDDIERAQTPSLVELLSRQVGVEFARSGGAGAQASLFIRGASSAQTLVLVDGVRINTSTGGAAVLGGVALDTVERIEIVRGNLSSLYGSEAIGGVVQIFTRSGRTSGVEAAAEAGADETRALSAAGRYVAGGTRLAASVARRRSEPFSAIDTTRLVASPFAPGANPDIDGNDNRSGSLSAGHRWDSGWELEGSAWTSRNDTDFDSTADGTTATHKEEARSDVYRVALAAPLSAAWLARLSAGEARERSDNRVSDPFSFNNGSFDARNRQVTLANEVRVAEEVLAVVGLESLRQSGASTSYDPNFTNQLTEFERTVKSAWFGLTGATPAQAGGGRHRVQLSVRHDDYSDVGTATTGLASYRYDFASFWSVGAQASNAFRAPSFNDLYFPFFGNPQLKPEESTSGELALGYTREQLQLRAAAYRTRTRDLIVFDPATSLAQNVARATLDGIELSARQAIGGWRIDANASFTRPVDDATGERLLRRAARVLNVGVDRDFGRWSAGAGLSYNGVRFDSDINTFARTELPAYTLLRLYGAWRVTEQLTITARLENLTDEQYELVSGYNTPRRGGFVGVVARL